ncbi:hypothetical protein VNI00_002497 [Paramarasmius palmivorus]|uniref:DUF262 domain-containing protein n=1 Tax=Paramarasmius palmivorus TaxID=297713 RepID=A0AAW0DY30_9AGAR
MSTTELPGVAEIRANRILLDTGFQRDPSVWSQEMKDNYIDTCRKFSYTGSFQFAIQVDNTGAEIRICIDGKQRLLSLLEYTEGAPNTSRQWVNNPNSSQLVSHPYAITRRQRIEAMTVTCFEYHEISEETQKDIFRRSNLGATENLDEL